jgi:hypothetical protein
MVNRCGQRRAGYRCDAESAPCEPLLEELTFPTMECFDWVIIGAQSSSGALKEKQPEAEWVKSLMTQAWKADCKVYCKPNLKALIKEYPETSNGACDDS